MDFSILQNISIQMFYHQAKTIIRLFRLIFDPINQHIFDFSRKCTENEKFSFIDFFLIIAKQRQLEINVEKS